MELSATPFGPVDVATTKVAKNRRRRRRHPPMASMVQYGVLLENSFRIEQRWPNVLRLQ